MNSLAPPRVLDNQRNSMSQDVNSKNRAIAFAELRKQVRMRLREADDTYAKSSPLVKNSRRLALLGVYLFTWSDMLLAGCIVLAAVLHLPWLELDVCLCNYRCNGKWHEMYFATPTWNKTFVPEHCGGRTDPWTCQVMGDWDTCVCNEQGTSAVDHGLLLNVDGCNFFKLTFTYLLTDGLIVLMGAFMTTSMFKMSCYSAKKDPVNLGGFIFFYLPLGLQKSLFTPPSESKALFEVWWRAFLFFWILSVSLVGYAKAVDSSLLDAEYKMPEHFTKVQLSATRAHYFVIALQSVGLAAWRMGFETSFKVVPRIRQISLLQPGDVDPARGRKQQGGVIYDFELDGHKRRREHDAHGISGGRQRKHLLGANGAARGLVKGLVGGTVHGVFDGVRDGFHSGFSKVRHLGDSSSDSDDEGAGDNGGDERENAGESVALGKLRDIGGGIKDVGLGAAGLVGGLVGGVLGGARSGLDAGLGAIFGPDFDGDAGPVSGRWRG